MTFVTAGLAIAGAVGILIPILIHLLSRQRRRPIEWAAMRFLIEAFRRHRRRLQIEQLVLLAVRCLIILLLGAGLARPLLDAAGLLDSDDQRAVILIIDNGLASSVGEEPEGTALTRQIEQAVAVIASLGPSESVGVIAAASPVATPVLPPSLDHAAVVSVVRALSSAESRSDIAGALRAAHGAAEDLRSDGRNVVVYLLSEFRAGSAPLDAPLTDLFGDEESAELTLLASPPALEPALNVQVVDVAPVRRLILPGANDGSQQVTVTLSRHGGDLARASSRVRLTGDDATAALAARDVEWAAGQSTASLTFTADFARSTGREIGLTASVEDDDALEADNRRHVTLDVRERLRVALVSPPTFERIAQIERLTPGQWIRRALRTSEESAIDVVDVPPAALDDVELRSSDVAIVTRPDRLTDSGWRALRTFVDRGGLAIFVPPSDVNVHPWSQRLATDLGLPWRLQLEVVSHPTGLLMAPEQPSSELLHLLQGELADLTRSLLTYRVLPIDAAQTEAQTLLTFEDGSPMMIMGSPRNDDGSESDGLVVYLATAPLFPEWTTLPIQMFMVPLFQETVRQGLNLIRASQEIRVGDRPTLAGLPRAADSLSASNGDLIPLDPSRRPTRPLSVSGLYEVLDAAGAGVSRIAVNLDPEAGRTDPQSAAAVGSWLEASGPWRTIDPADPAGLLANAEGDAALSGILLALVLALLILETVLQRHFSHAYREGQGEELPGGLKPTILDLRRSTA